MLKAKFKNIKISYYRNYYGDYSWLSSKTGINYRTLLRIVNNQVECSITNALKIAKALGKTVEEIFILPGDYLYDKI